MFRKLSILSAMIVSMLVICSAAVYADTNIILEDNMELDRIEDENITITSTGHYSLTVKNGINATGSITIDKAAVIVKNFGIVASGDINISNQAFVDSYSKEVVDHYGPRAIASKNGKVTVTDSMVQTEISDGGSYVIYSCHGFKAKSAIINMKTGNNSSGGISTYNNGAGIDIRDSAVTADIKRGDGMSAYRGDVYLENIFAELRTGSEGISGYDKVEIINSGITIDGGKEEPGAGLPPGGMFAYGSIKIDGGILTSKSELGDGIYANDDVIVTNSTERVEASGKDYAIKTGSGGKILLESDLCITEPQGGKVSEQGNMIVDKNGVSAKDAVITGPSHKPDPVPVVKKTNPLKAKGKTYKVSRKTVKKKKVVVKTSKVIKFTNKGKGTLTYKKMSGNGKITINKKTGKVTIKKGLKKGKYTVKIKITAKGNSTYRPKSVTVKSKIVVR